MPVEHHQEPSIEIPGQGNAAHPDVVILMVVSDIETGHRGQGLRQCPIAVFADVRRRDHGDIGRCFGQGLGVQRYSFHRRQVVE